MSYNNLIFFTYRRITFIYIILSLHNISILKVIKNKMFFFCKMKKVKAIISIIVLIILPFRFNNPRIYAG
jgi:hypothetical protein